LGAGKHCHGLAGYAAQYEEVEYFEEMLQFFADHPIP
jgi:hypothetical protein